MTIIKGYTKTAIYSYAKAYRVLLNDMGMGGEICDTSRESIHFHPINSQPWSDRAELLAGDGKFSEVNESLDSSSTLSSVDKAIRNSKALVPTFHLKAYEESLETYNRSLAMDTDDGSSWLGKAEALRQLGRHWEAIVAYSAAITLLPENSQVWYGLGLSLRSLGHGDQAREVLKRAKWLGVDEVQ